MTVLGPPGLSCGGAELDLGAPQQQAVLMLLLARSGSFVRVGELVDGLWGYRAPATGEAVIRTYIFRIRRVFSAHGLASAIRSQAGGLFRVDLPVRRLRARLDRRSTVAVAKSALGDRAVGAAPAGFVRP
ncbi:hypothetical protein AVL48_20115 [Amycolatopsis regifaucium]|uniref:OmpR/PhoB-type domain-containing protein n=1 Tax=Amycolatopsis regifaucium TaxID=546365 RepID=A0A154MWF0_9PSEU|nr:hypothetical protein AVL48_20115 [Amycolatopsis regifaucium]